MRVPKSAAAVRVSIRLPREDTPDDRAELWDQLSQVVVWLHHHN